MSDKDPFSGSGFSREPLSDDELASHREMKHKLSDAWPFVEAGDDLTKGAKRLLTLIAGAAAIGAAIAWAVKQGYFT
tara:strand:- start:293 stop:523 length:231 start_codon:yes stop_codon:yes gene_type:complete